MVANDPETHENHVDASHNQAYISDQSHMGRVRAKVGASAPDTFQKAAVAAARHASPRQPQRASSGAHEEDGEGDETDGDDKERPSYSYARLAVMAISALGGRAKVVEIYAWIEENYPYYKNGTQYWKNCIRHNLSIKKFFQRSGQYWYYLPELDDMLENRKGGAKMPKVQVPDAAQTKQPSPMMRPPQAPGGPISHQMTQLHLQAQMEQQQMYIDHHISQLQAMAQNREGGKGPGGAHGAAAAAAFQAQMAAGMPMGMHPLMLAQMNHQFQQQFQQQLAAGQQMGAQQQMGQAIGQPPQQQMNGQQHMNGQHQMNGGGPQPMAAQQMNGQQMGAHPMGQMHNALQSQVMAQQQGMQQAGMMANGGQHGQQQPIMVLPGMRPGMPPHMVAMDNGLPEHIVRAQSQPSAQVQVRGAPDNHHGGVMFGAPQGHMDSRPHGPSSDAMTASAAAHSRPGGAESFASLHQAAEIMANPGARAAYEQWRKSGVLLNEDDMQIRSRNQPVYKFDPTKKHAGLPLVPASRVAPHATDAAASEAAAARPGKSRKTARSKAGKRGLIQLKDSAQPNASLKRFQTDGPIGNTKLRRVDSDGGSFLNGPAEALIPKKSHNNGPLAGQGADESLASAKATTAPASGGAHSADTNVTACEPTSVATSATTTAASPSSSNGDAGSSPGAELRHVSYGPEKPRIGFHSNNSAIQHFRLGGTF
eukprot:m.159478 g.159478  ORF g.159478 m.159478 type:complete len:706 (-) comp11799_c0_seq1:204-2321(-)